MANSINVNRADFPALANKQYFNFGGQGTMPKVALDAISSAYNFVQEKGPFSTEMYHWMVDQLAATRNSLNEELGGAPECWALTTNVTEGCNIAMWGLDWQPGEHILLTDSEHNGVVAAAQNLARRFKLTVNYFSVAEKSSAEILDALNQAITPRTRLCVFSHVLWNTGQLLPVAEMVDLLQRFGAQSLVDGAQTAGAIALDLSKTDIDYYTVTGHKWMCGPEGFGGLYVRRERLGQLMPTFVGWRTNMSGGPGNPDGSRYEVATSALPLLAGFRAAVGYHRKFGNPEDREEIILAKTNSLREQLRRIEGLRIIADGDAQSGLTSFAFENLKHSKVVADLEAEHIMLRTIPQPDAVRASVHYFTEDSDIARLVEALKKIAA